MRRFCLKPRSCAQKWACSSRLNWRPLRCPSSPLARRLWSNPGAKIPVFLSSPKYSSALIFRALKMNLLIEVAPFARTKKSEVLHLALGPSLLLEAQGRQGAAGKTAYSMRMFAQFTDLFYFWSRFMSYTNMATRALKLDRTYPVRAQRELEGP